MVSPYQGTIINNVEVIRLGTPLHAQIELTSRCQYKCFFCYNIWKSEEGSFKHAHMTKDQAIFVANELIRCRIFSVIFSGGEPTLVDYLPELSGIFADAGVDVTMISNGANLTKKLLEDLKENGLRNIQISMHHYEEDVFNRITGNPNAYAMTLQGIKNTLEILGPESLNVNMVVTSDTLEDIYPMSDFLYEKGVRSMSVSLVSTSGQAALNGLLCTHLDLEEAYEQMSKAQEKMPISFVGGLPFCSLPSHYDPSLVSMSNVCDAGITQIVVGPNGGLRPCVEWPEEAGNIFKDDIIDIWKNSKVFEDIRKFKNTPVVCRDCEQVPHCHGGCRASALAATKSICGYDPMMKPLEV